MFVTVARALAEAMVGHGRTDQINNRCVHKDSSFEALQSSEERKYKFDSSHYRIHDLSALIKSKTHQ